jgi:hypothetical protein
MTPNGEDERRISQLLTLDTSRKFHSPYTKSLGGMINVNIPIDRVVPLNLVEFCHQKQATKLTKNSIFSVINRI